MLKLPSRRLPPSLKFGLVGYWPFDDGTATDLSGFNNRGVLSGSTGVPVPSQGVPPGLPGGALLFVNANSQYVDCSNSALLNQRSELSIFSWIYPNNIGSTFHQILMRNQGNANYVGITIPAGGAWTAQSSTNGDLSSTITPTTGKWQHVGFTASAQANSRKLFHNGVQVASGTWSTQASIAANFAIGVDLVNNRYFDGSIDDVRYYNRALAPSEVGALYLAGLQSFYEEDFIAAAAAGGGGGSQFASRWYYDMRRYA